MIFKSFDLKKIYEREIKYILFYGKNDGLKDQLINDVFINNFKGEIVKIEENEILIDTNGFISSLINKSLFDDEKLIIISRSTDKFLCVIEEIVERKVDKIRLILNADTLEKKSKLRNFFEKGNDLGCVAFYEDRSQDLINICQSFFRENNISTSRETMNLLSERARGDRKNLINELEKIKSLSLTKKNLSTEDILKLTNLAEDYSVFDLIENYLCKNQKKVSNILNENNFNNDDCILILRTTLNRAKRLLSLKNYQEEFDNIEQALTTYKPPIFWKEKEAVKRQINCWEKEDIKKLIYKINSIEKLVKNNPVNSMNFVSDFLLNY